MAAYFDLLRAAAASAAENIIINNNNNNNKGWRGSRRGSRAQILEIRIDQQYTHFHASGDRNAWAHLFTRFVVLGGDKQ